MNRLHHDMTLNDILKMKPTARGILFEYGLYSENHQIRGHETLQEAARADGLSDDQIDEIMEKLRALP